jgi:large repetitive protein
MHMRALIAVAALLLVALPLSAAITGVVMTGDGKAIPGASVGVYEFESEAERRTRLLSDSPQRVPLSGVKTDAKGSFSLESPKQPVVAVLITAAGYAPAHRLVERDEDLGAIALAVAETRSGSVTAAGRPVAGATVAISYGAAEYVTQTDEEGRYQAPHPRSARITILHPDFAVEEVVPMGASDAVRMNHALQRGSPLSGIVTAADGKTPVAGATVLVDGWPLATSGEDGAFSTDRARARWTSIVASKGDLLGQRAWSSARSQSIRLERPARITGRVLDSRTKTSVAGASVSVSPRTFGRIFSLGVSGQTDEKGAFSIAVAPGDHIMTLRHPGFEQTTVDLVIGPGQQVSRETTLTRLARVSGTVVDEGRNPVAAATLNQEEAQQSPMRGMRRFINRAEVPVMSGPDGRFSVRVTPEEEILLRATRRGLPPARSDSFKLSPGERKSGVVLTIPSGIAISGRVTDSEGNPLSGVSVTAAEGDPMSRIMTFRTMVGGAPRDDDGVLTASDGTFTLRVREGTHDFSFRREGYAPRSIRGQNVTKSSVPAIDVVLEPAVEITGRVVRDGAGIPEVRVSSFSPTDSNTVTTGPDGSFTLGGLAPGVAPLDIRKEEEFIAEGRNITAPARDVLIEIPVGGRITGRVVEKGTSKPVTRFQAGISTSSSGGGMVRMGPPQLQSFTSDDGSFTLEHVPPGAQVVIALAPGFTAAQANLNVEGGKTIENVEIGLDRGVTLTGRVTGPNGAPVSDARVGLVISAGSRAFGLGGRISSTTDSRGEYTIEALPAGEETIAVTHPRYTDVRKTVALKGRETRLDIQLSSGITVRGTVVSESGSPIADAFVEARELGGGIGMHRARSDANGAFEFEALVPTRHNFTASKAGFSQTVLKDVDVAAGAPLRITLRMGGTIHGRVSGLSADELTMTSVTAFASGTSASAPVDASGNYRMEGAPTGSVQVRASVSARAFGGSKSSPPQTVELTAGGTQQVDITFRGDVVIRGRVLRNGMPLRGGSVMFSAKAGGGGSSGTIDEQGHYSVAGLEEGEYNVRVMDLQRFSGHTTTYSVRGSSTFDITFRTASLRGRVVDSATSEPIDGATIDIRNTTDTFGGGGATSDTSGSFVIDHIIAGSYTATASKAGYGSQVFDVQLADGATETLDFRLMSSEGVTMQVVDARNGQPLAAGIRVFDPQGRMVYDGRSFFDASAERRLPLAPGSYTATVQTNGFAARHVSFTSPSKQTIPLSPGGTLLVQSKHPMRLRARLIDSMGLTYPRWGAAPQFWNLLPSPGTTTFQHIAPGTYTLQLIADNDAVIDSRQIVVQEGQTVTTEI